MPCSAVMRRGELVAMLVEQGEKLRQDAGAADGRRIRPLRERRRRAGDRAIHERRVRQGHAARHLAGGRVEDLLGARRLGRHRPAADPVPDERVGAARVLAMEVRGV